MSKNRYHALERALDRGDRAAVATAIASLTDYEKDLLVDCSTKGCHAAEREACVGVEKNKVHFGRRIKRLLEGIR